MLHTRDGKHWSLDDPRRTSRRSRPPAGPSSVADVDHSRAPSKVWASAQTSPVVLPRVLFPTSTSETSRRASPYDRESTSDRDDEGSPNPADQSFLNNFVPRSIPGPDLLARSSAVLQSTASALHTTASAVRHMFGSSSDRPSGARPQADAARTSSTNDTPRARTTTGDPTPQQFADLQFAHLQLRYAALQRRLDDLTSRQSVEQRARAIDDDIELRRRTAYEAANIPYSPRLHVPHSPLGGSVNSPIPPRHQEYRISHKSIGFLRPADPSNKPFEAVDGEVYVWPLAWLAHLRTKIELKDDFNYKNQVLQVASECLVGRAAAWWTAIGQRMRNILLTDYTLDLWHQYMQVLCQCKEQTRKEALERSWRVEKEECWDYVWDKAALFEELGPRDRPYGVALISEILDGLPTSQARMSRIEFGPNPTVSDLTKELQVLVPRWRRDFAPRERSSRSVQARPPDLPPAGRRQPQGQSERTPLSASYDKSKIGLQLHPVTKKLTRCYAKPNGSVIFLNWNCSCCNEAHFDFELDSFRPLASAQLALVEFGYEVWDAEDSDITDHDALSKKLN